MVNNCLTPSARGQAVDGRDHPLRPAKSWRLTDFPREVFTRPRPGADIAHLHNVSMPPFLTASIQGSKPRNAAKSLALIGTTHAAADPGVIVSIAALRYPRLRLLSAKLMDYPCD